MAENKEPDGIVFYVTDPSLKKYPEDFDILNDTIKCKYRKDGKEDPTSIRDYLYTELSDTRALVLKGTTRFGKTTFAKALAAALAIMNQCEEKPLCDIYFIYVKSFQALKNVEHLIKPGVVLVLDDITPRNAIISGHDPGDFVKGMCDIKDANQLRVLYGVVHIPAGVPRIFLTNKEEDSWLPVMELGCKAAAQERYVLGELRRKLYTLDAEAGQVRHIREAKEEKVRRFRSLRASGAW